MSVSSLGRLRRGRGGLTLEAVTELRNGAQERHRRVGHLRVALHGHVGRLVEVDTDATRTHGPVVRRPHRAVVTLHDVLEATLGDLLDAGVGLVRTTRAERARRGDGRDEEEGALAGLTMGAEHGHHHLSLMDGLGLAWHWAKLGSHYVPLALVGLDASHVNAYYLH